MEDRPQSAEPDGVREWLLQLEHRVTELERENVRTGRRRRRALWLMALFVVAYVIFFQTMTSFA